MATVAEVEAVVGTEYEDNEIARDDLQEEIDEKMAEVEELTDEVADLNSRVALLLEEVGGMELQLNDMPG